MMFSISGTYNKWISYGQSKTANILFAKWLNELLRRQNANVTVNALHPGVIRTNLSRHMDESDTKMILSRPFRYKTIPQGAATTVWVATDPEFEKSGGNYCFDCAIQTPMAYAADLKAAERLWALTERMIAQGPSSVAPTPEAIAAAQQRIADAAANSKTAAASAAPAAAQKKTG